jgi:hypothetical protein
VNDDSLEERHRDELQMLGAIARMKYTYYKDAEIDDAILPLVKLFNSPWTVTLFSCGGHFTTDARRFQYPYIFFAVLYRKKRAWEAIARRMRIALEPHLRENATLYVQTSYVWPESSPDTFIWRFCPFPHRESRKNFKSEEAYISTIYSFVDRVHSACEQAMDFEK